MRRAARRNPRRRRGEAPLFSIEDRQRVVDRPITSGYRNDAMRIDTGGIQSAGADLVTQATGLTLLERDFEPALARLFLTIIRQRLPFQS